MRPMRRLAVVFVALTFVALITAVWGAGLPSSIGGVGLDSLLGKQLGLTGDQSQGSLGSILGLAKEKLASGDFDKLLAMIPGGDKYLAKAKSMGLLGKPIGNASGLDSRFTKMGIPKETASKIVPTVTDMVGKVGGDSAKAMLESALK